MKEMEIKNEKVLYNAFCHDLGNKGAAIQFVELSIRYLIKHEKSILIGKNNKDTEFKEEVHKNLQKLGTQFDIGITDMKEEILYSQLGLMYISQVQQSFEYFLKKYYTFIISNQEESYCKTKEDNSYIDWVNKNKKRLFDKITPEIEDAIFICKYYWNIRNNYIHTLEKRVSIPKLKKSKIEINEYENINYEDFKNYSSSSLYLTKELSKYNKLSIKKLSKNFEIMKKSEKGLLEEVQYRKFKKRIENICEFPEEELKKSFEQLILNDEYY
ncbi:hypothetical protein [Vagococcus fluvialis]|uniref:hypothetical protein n=1 Tax=Vagococcus fluvialis TaxID=2738 RepID=UPI00378BA19E